MPERVTFKFTLMVHNCIHHKAPGYLTDYCIPISDVANQWHLRSARRHYLVVPRHSLSSYGRRAFAVAGPTAWNSLSDEHWAGLGDNHMVLSVAKLWHSQRVHSHLIRAVLAGSFEWSDRDHRDDCDVTPRSDHDWDISAPWWLKSKFFYQAVAVGHLLLGLHT